MTPGNEPHPIPDPARLQPQGLTNRTKRWLFLGVIGVILLIVVANIIGGTSSAPVEKQPKSVAQQQQQANPSASQIDDMRRTLEAENQALVQKTAADAANLKRLQADQGRLSSDDLTKAAALQEAADARNRFHRDYPETRQGGGTRQEATKPAITDNVIRNGSAQLAPVLAPWQQQPVKTAEARETDRDAAQEQRQASATTAKQRKALDFDPSLKTYWLPEGTVIEGVLTNRLDGSNNGPANVMLTTDVFLPGTKRILIPQGARALGEATKVSVLGQDRLAVAFHRILVPGLSAYSIPLDVKPPALAQAGEVGLRDKVNNHYAQIFGASLAVGAIGGLAQIGNSQSGFGYDPGVSFRNGVTQSTAQSADRILERLLNRLPSLQVREGTRTKILLVDDLQVPAYPAVSTEGTL